MNTDNMSLLGLTLDYGPYGFIDAYVPDFVCNHSDPGGRYALDQQPAVGYWNLQSWRRRWPATSMGTCWLRPWPSTNTS